MSFTRSILGALVVTLAVTTSAAAQERAVRLYARSGGFNAVTDLNEAGTADFKKVGYNVGGGIGVQLQRLVTVRADLTYARNELRANGLETGEKLDRFLYDATVQLQYPTQSGVAPYLFVGGGAVTAQEAGTDGDHQTTATGTFGLGLDYRIPNTDVGLFVEGRGWLYDASNLDGVLAQFDKTQVEIGWSGGLSYSLPF